MEGVSVVVVVDVAGTSDLGFKSTSGCAAAGCSIGVFSTFFAAVSSLVVSVLVCGSGGRVGFSSSTAFGFSSAALTTGSSCGFSTLEPTE